MAGEEENLLSLSQVHEEAQRLPLPLFIEANENIVQHHRKWFDLFTEGKRHSQANGKEHLVAGAGGPDFRVFHMMLPVNDADFFAVIGNGERIFPLRHGLQEGICLLHDLGLFAGLVSRLRLFQQLLGIHIRKPFGEGIFQLPFDTLFFLQGLGDGIIVGQAENFISHCPLLLLQVTESAILLFDFLSKGFMVCHPLVILPAFERLPQGIEGRFAAGVEAKVLPYIFPFLHQLVMAFVGIHLRRKFLGVFGVHQPQERIHLPLAGRPAVIELPHFPLIGFMLVVFLQNGLPRQTSLVSFLIKFLNAVRTDTVIHMGHGNDGIRPLTVHIQLAVHLFQPEIQDFSLPFGGIDFLPLLLQSGEIFRRGLGQLISCQPFFPVLLCFGLFLLEKLTLFRPFLVLLLLLFHGFPFPGSRLPFRLVLVEIRAPLLHAILERLQFRGARRRLAIEGRRQFLAPFF